MATQRRVADLVATSTMTTAASKLDASIEKVQTVGPEPLRKTLSAFKNWRHEILAFFQFLPMRLSNGFVEGKNNRTKAMMRQGMAIAIAPICVYVFYWAMSHERFATFPHKDGEPHFR